MLNIEQVSAEIIEEGKTLGYIADPAAFESEGQAESKGYYWYDEITAWLNIGKMIRLV